MKSNQRRQWQPTPALLPGKSHGRRNLIGYSPWGHKESDTTEWLHIQIFYSFKCKWESVLVYVANINHHIFSSSSNANLRVLKFCISSCTWHYMSEVRCMSQCAIIKFLAGWVPFWRVHAHSGCWWNSSVLRSPFSCWCHQFLASWVYPPSHVIWPPSFIFKATVG